MLNATHVSKTYTVGQNVVRALDDVSVRVDAGQFVTVKGPSGCGKTTLLLAAGALMAPDAGTVEIEGVDPYGLAPDPRAAFRATKIGFVFQQFYLVPYLSVLDNVLTPSLACPRHDAADRAKHLVARFGLTERSDHMPGELSTGERQRTALARAMLNEPKLILADEPTGNLDQDNAHGVLEALAEFASAGGAVLLVTHDDKVAQYAHRTIHISQGRLCAE